MKKLIATIMVLVFVLACMPAALADTSKYGDVDGNDTINIFDATAIQNHIAKAVLLSDDMAVLADVDANEEVNIIDVTFVQCYVAKIITSFPAGETKPEESTTPTQKPTTGMTTEEFELEVLRLVNEERAKEGLQPYEFGYHIHDCAKLRAQELLTVYDHMRPDGTPFFSVFDELGVKEPWSALGENIVMGSSSPQSAVSAWMSSTAGHREQILDPDYEYMAVGACEIPNAPGRYAVVQLFWAS